MPGDIDSNGSMDNLFYSLQSSIKAWEGPVVYIVGTSKFPHSPSTGIS